MKRILAAGFVVLMFIACGDDSTGPTDDGGGNNNPEPQATAPGTPNGAATNAIIGAAGGTLSSSDGALSIDVPAGALASDTDITIQPITNTAWGGIGGGYRLTPDGLTFAQPVDLVFDVAPEDLEGSHPDFLDVAVQDDEGFWYVIRDRTFDEIAGTLTSTTTHFSDYSMIGGLQIRPASASVGTGGRVELQVKYCHQVTISDPTDPLVAFVYDCDAGLAPLETLSNWSVNGISGGNNTVGRTLSTRPLEATFFAPASVPQNNPVAVSVQARGRRSTQTLVSNITIGGEWYGTATADWGDGEKIVATVVWKSNGTFQNIETFTARGLVKYYPDTDYGEVCDFVSMTPDTVSIQAIDGHLIINHSTTPATWYGGGSSVLSATTCYICDGWKEPDCQGFLYALTWLDADEADGWEVSEDGQTISKAWIDLRGSGVAYVVEFQRGAPPGP